MLSFHSPKGSRDSLFLSNYISINVKDALTRLRGVSEAYIFGEQEYSMRIWMNPERLTALGMTADDVIQAIRQQNVQAAAGAVGAAPTRNSQQVQYTLRAKGRLDQAGEFADIIVRTNADGGVVRVRDVARVELGSASYASRSTLNGSPSVNMAVYQSSGANSLDAVRSIEAEMEHLAGAVSGRRRVPICLRHHPICQSRH